MDRDDDYILIKKWWRLPIWKRLMILAPFGVWAGLIAAYPTIATFAGLQQPTVPQTWSIVGFGIAAAAVVWLRKHVH